MFRRSLVPTVLLLLAVAGCTCREGIDAPVVSPEGPQDELPTFARIQLSRPLYDPAQPVGKLPVPKAQVKPAVPFRTSISSPYTVDVDFAQPLAPATDYEVTLLKGLASVDGKAETKNPVVVRFRTPLNRLQHVASFEGSGAADEEIALPLGGKPDGEIAGLGPTQGVRLQFRYPVSLAQAKQLVQLFVKDGQALPVQLAMEKDPGTEVTLASSTPWPRDTRLVLSVAKGLKVAGDKAGPLASEAAQSVEIHTYGPLQVDEGPDADEGGCVPTKTFQLGFNNPVACKDAVEKLSSNSPSESQFKCVSDLTSRLFTVEAQPPLEGNAEVSVTVAAGLADAYGEKLSEAKTFSFRTCAPNTQFAYQKPFVILDPGQPPEQVERVIGAAQVKVEGKRLPLSAAWKVLQDAQLTDQVAWTELPWWLQYGDEGWGDESDSKKPGEISAAAIEELKDAQSTTLPVKGDGWQDVSVGLDQYLGGKKGIVLLRATPQNAAGQAAGVPVLRLVNVTDIGLTVRASQDTLVVLAARYSDGKPLGGAKLNVLSEKGSVLGSGETGADGVLKLPVSKLTNVANLHQTPLLVVATKDDDEAFVWSRFVTESPNEGPGVDLVGLVYPDRGIYRPGESGHLKAVVRFADANGFASAAGQMAKLTVRDPDETNLLSEDIQVSDWGTLAKDFTIPKTAKVGTYQVTVAVGQDSVAGEFLVGEFRRAEMKVEIQAPPKASWGETLKAVVQGDYLFGAPAAGLDVRWSLSRMSNSFQSQRFPSAHFRDASLSEWDWDERGSSQILSEGTGKLDDKGAFNLAQRLKLPDPVSQLERVTISASVDETNGQSVSRATSLDLYAAKVLVGVESTKYLLTAKDPYSLSAVVVTPDDQPAANTEVRILTRQTSWRSVRRAGPGGGYYWTSERVVENDVERCKGTTDATGRFNCTFTPNMGGSMQIVAEAKDAPGRKVKAASWHWVTGDSEYWGESSDNSSVGVLFEKDTVEAGQTAKVALTSPFRDGVALVTVEREDILWQKSFPIGTSATIEIPTDAAWAPNVHVVATVVRGRLQPQPGSSDSEREKPAYAVGRRELKVKPKNAALDVKVSMASARLEPGQQQTVSAQVNGPDGKPLEGAEVNLWAVDEGVLMLTNYKTPDVLASMFRERRYTTLGLDTRAYILGKRIFVEPVTKGEEDGGGGGDESDNSLRKNFEPVAVWQASAVTDAQGKVTATFNVPDNLTTYRVMAVAVSKADAFGSGDAQFKVNKTLMLRQALPRFARPGDKVTAGVLVNHLLDHPGKVQVSLESIDEKLFQVKSARQLEVEVQPNETKPVLFDFVVNDVDGAAEIRFAATMEGHKDRVELKIPVRRLTPRESVSVAGMVSSGNFTNTLNVPEIARPVSFEVNVSGFPVSALEHRLREMVEYPYGCLEQRTSRVMPLVAIRKLGDELGMKSIPSEQIKGWVEEYLTLVPKYRCSDDGFDYWPGCQFGSSTYLTSFALDGLLTVRRMGFDVPQGEIDRTVAYLKRMVQAGDKGKDLYQGHGHEDDNLTNALRVLAEAGNPLPEIEKARYDARSKLALFEKADLTRAIGFRLGDKAKGDESVRTLIDEIGKAGKRTGDSMTFDAENPEKYWWAWESNQRNTALVLRTLLQVQPADDRIPLLIKGLIDLDGASRYYVTQDVTQTLLGLADAVQLFRANKNKANVTVSAGGVQLAKDRSVGAKTETFALTADKIGAQIPLEIANSGNSPLFFGAFLTYAYPATARLPAASSGFTLSREYLGRDGKPLPLNKDGATPQLALKVGDFVKVRVHVQLADHGQFVVVEDPLPAGLEVVDTKLATSDQQAVRDMGGDGSNHWWEDYHREIRDDRVEWHFQEVWSGKMDLDYVARVTTAGSFHAPGSHAERMYQPAINGRAEAIDVTVKPKE